jgi:archaellum component FlaC
MIDYKLYKTIEILELTVDELSKQVHNLRQQQADMLEQIRRLKGEKDDCK